MTPASVIAVQVFDQKKFKKKGQGFLGVVNVSIGTDYDLNRGRTGDFSIYYYWEKTHLRRGIGDLLTADVVT